jgi:hypothetical protein
MKEIDINIVDAITNAKRSLKNKHIITYFFNSEFVHVPVAIIDVLSLDRLVSFVEKHIKTC